MTNSEGRPCVICGCPTRSRAYPVDLAYAADVSGVDLRDLAPRAVTCADCGHQYIHPLPSADFFHRFYASYMVRASRGFYRARAGATIPDEFRARYGPWLRKLRELSSRETPRLLDIGAGLGMFLRLSRERGFEPLALEPNTEACDALRDGYGIESINSSLEDAELSERFDVVTMWDLLEHLPDPHAALLQTRAALEPGGILALEVPARDSLLHRGAKAAYRLSLSRIRRPLYLVCGIHHLHYFSETGLRRLLDDVGFDVLESHRGETSLRALHRDAKGSLGKRLKATAYNATLDAAFGAARLLRQQNKLIVFAKKR